MVVGYLLLGAREVASRGTGDFCGSLESDVIQKHCSKQRFPAKSVGPNSTIRKYEVYSREVRSVGVRVRQRKHEMGARDACTVNVYVRIKEEAWLCFDWSNQDP
jgi:hypothetical protein